MSISSSLSGKIHYSQVLTDTTDTLKQTIDKKISIPVSAVQGDLLVRGASDWGRLPKGSEASILTIDSGVPAYLPSQTTLIIIAHTNAYASTEDTSYFTLYTSRFIHDPLRTQKRLRFTIIEKGNGNSRITVTDGTNSVSVTGVNQNSAAYSPSLMILDCASLVSSVLWTITVEGVAVTGEYELRRLSVSANQDYMLWSYPLILADPVASTNSTTQTVVDTKYFPINWAIDNSCVIHVTGYVLLRSGTTTSVRLKFTTEKLAVSTWEESTKVLTSSGYFDMLVPFPSIVAPFVKAEVYMSTDGSATLDHWEAWAEV